MPSIPPSRVPNTQINARLGLLFSSGTMAGSMVLNTYSGLTSASITVLLAILTVLDYTGRVQTWHVITIAGLFSLAAGLGGKSLVWGPVANAIVWGLAFSTLLTLIVIPLLYRLFMPGSYLLNRTADTD